MVSHCGAFITGAPRTTGDEMKDSDYDKLQEALMKAAIGEEHTTSSMTESTDENGRKRVSKQMTKKSAEPNPSLILKMMGERIGGPQDYC